MTIHRPWELPYSNPPVMQTLNGTPLDLKSLNPKKIYLWAVDEAGNFLLAPEDQRSTGFAPKRLNGEGTGPAPGIAKHGDLTPGPNGQTRGLCSHARQGSSCRSS